MQAPTALSRPKRRVHDWRGSHGWPVTLYAMNDNWWGLIVVHWREGVEPGDIVILGEGALNELTYTVFINAWNPKRKDGWGRFKYMAELHRAPRPVTITGVTYGDDGTDWVLVPWAPARPKYRRRYRRRRY